MKKTLVILIVAATLGLLVACGLVIYVLAPWASNLGAASESVESGVLKTDKVNLSGIHAIEFASFGELTVNQGEAEGLTIQGDSKILSRIKTEISDGELTIRAEPQLEDTLRTNKNVLYTLTVKQLDTLIHSGVGNVYARNINCDQLSVTLSGGGTLEFSGEANDQTVTISGAGSYKAGDLKTRTTRVSVTGVGSAEVWATDTLDATITSVGSVNYYGNPRLTKEVSGLGGVSRLEGKD